MKHFFNAGGDLATGWEELEGPIQEIMKLVSVGSTENTWDTGLS